MISEAQKNENILNRFESKEIGTKMKAYRIKVRGEHFPMPCPNGDSIEEDEKTCASKCGKHFGKLIKVGAWEDEK